MICSKCKKEVAIQDAYREAAKEYYCSTCWKARPLQHMPPGKYEHGCEFSNCDHETCYCCYQIKGESLKLKTMPEDGYYTDEIEIKFCPFCGYTIPFKIDHDNNFYGQTVDLSKIENLQMTKSDDPEHEENLEIHRSATELVCKLYDKLYKEGKIK